VSRQVSLRVIGHVLLLIASIALLSACASDPRSGYALTDQRVAGVRTVEVPIFRNRTNAPGLELELTEAIIKEVQASTDMRVVQSTSQSSRADSVLAGTITKAELRALSLRDGTGLVQEVAVQLVVDFSWRRAGYGATREDALLVARQNFSAADTFVASRPTGERLELGESSAIQRMAKSIVSEMRGAW